MRVLLTAFSSSSLCSACCCKGVSETSLAPVGRWEVPAGEVAWRAERTCGTGRGPAPAERGGGAGKRRGRVAALGAGARTPGRSQAREPASRMKWVPPLPLQRLLPPPPPPPPPQSQARPPRTCAKRHRRVRGRGTDPRGGTGTRLPRPPLRWGVPRRQGGGRKGQGERRVRGRPQPVRKAQALRPPGHRRCHRRDAPRPAASPGAPHPQTAHSPAR